MKVAYFDCFAGISGDMIIGGLLDAGLEVRFLEEELEKLRLSGYRIEAKRANRRGISGIRFDVKVSEGHSHRSLGDIIEIIDQSHFEAHIKSKSKSIFTRLAEAEARIHDKLLDEIHFHEVGAVDAIVDVIGATIGLDQLKIDRVFASKIRLGSGTLECAHGTLPVPPPATLELLQGVPVESAGIESELVTPTGAAVISTLAEGYGGLPPMQIERTGYGLGARDLPIPNVLRVVIGESSEAYEEDEVQLIETNIDDMNPQFYEHIMEVLFENGARDVFLTPIIMKKNRPGVVLSVLSAPQKIDALAEIIFRETTTLGLRISETKKRQVLEREIVKVSSPWGEARVKIRTVEGSRKTAAPEYDDCKRLAQKHGLPIRQVYEGIRRTAEDALSAEK